MAADAGSAAAFSAAATPAADATASSGFSFFFAAAATPSKDHVSSHLENRLFRAYFLLKYAVRPGIFGTRRCRETSIFYFCFT